MNLTFSIPLMWRLGLVDRLLSHVDTNLLRVVSDCKIICAIINNKDILLFILLIVLKLHTYLDELLKLWSIMNFYIKDENWMHLQALFDTCPSRIDKPMASNLVELQNYLGTHLYIPYNKSSDIIY